jgi:hypothetical protein
MPLGVMGSKGGMKRNQTMIAMTIKDFMMYFVSILFFFASAVSITKLPPRMDY